jgi:hypothetical protein
MPEPTLVENLSGAKLLSGAYARVEHVTGAPLQGRLGPYPQTFYENL